MTTSILLKEKNPHTAVLTIEGKEYEITIGTLLQLSHQAENLYHKMVEDAR